MTGECKSCLSNSSEQNPLSLEGICRECIDFRPLNNESKDVELSSILEKNKGKKYDCLIALSGGKDSIYLLYYLGKIQNRRLFALTWDHGHMRDIVWRNIHTALQYLEDIEWESFAYRHDYMTMVRQALLMEVKNMCMCAHFVNLRAIQTCISGEIPFIAFGFSPAQTYRRGKFTILEEEKRHLAFNKYVAAFRTLVHHCLDVHYPRYADEVTSYLFQPLEDNLNTSAFFPVFLEVSSYVPWKPATIKKIVNEMGWRKDPCQEGDLHTNCIYEPMRGYIEYLTGKSLVISELNYNIRAGEMGKDESLGELQAAGYGDIPPTISDRFFDFIKLSKREFYRTLATPISPEVKGLLIDFIRAGYVVRGYEETATKI